MKETIKSMSNQKDVGPEELPVELLKLVLDGDRDGNRRILEQINAIVIDIWQGGGVPQEEMGICHDHSAAQEEGPD